MTDKIVVLTTCETVENAEEIARKVVDLRLAACVQILPPIKSVYRWQGEVTEAAEILLVIKTRRDALSALQTELERLHTYEIPEVVALPIVDGLPRYLDWIDEQTR